MPKPIIEVENLSKLYHLGLIGSATFRASVERWWYCMQGKEELCQKIGSRKRVISEDDPQIGPSPNTIWALNDITFSVQPGEIIGIVGRNGAGKSTLLKILSRITAPTTGRAVIRGRMSSLLEVGIGFHPELTGRENIYLNGAILGMRRAEIDRKIDEIIAFAEIEKFIDSPIKRYSSGMYVRLAFAVAAHLEPEILLIDEVLAVGDVAFQKKCLGKMEDVAKGGRTIVFVSHSMGAILQLCENGILLDRGRIKAMGNIRGIVDTYLAENIKLEGENIFSENRPLLSNDAWFTSIRILNDQGQPSANVDLLKGLTVEVEYKVARPVRRAQVALELWNSMGVCVLLTSDLDEHPEEAENVKPPGSYRARCFIPSSYLRAGQYCMNLHLSIPGLQWFDEIANAIAFEVVDSGSIELKLSQIRRGVITPILKWETVQLVKEVSPPAPPT